MGGLALIMGLPALFGQLLLSGGSRALAAILLDINRQQVNWSHAVMGLGVVAWNSAGCCGRVLRPRPAAMIAFILIIGVILGGLLLSIGWLALGVRVAGVGLLGLGGWLRCFDIARRTVRQTGLTRYIALCLLPGYGWLVVAGGLWAIGAERFSSGPWYDAMVQSVLVGYVLSMIFGHAPIILPAVTGVALPYRPGFYIHLALLHAGLVVRVIGDLASAPGWRQWGGLHNATAIVLFLLVSRASVLRGQHPRLQVRSNAPHP